MKKKLILNFSYVSIISILESYFPAARSKNWRVAEESNFKSRFIVMLR